jgi:hypothetical protein
MKATKGKAVYAVPKRQVSYRIKQRLLYDLPILKYSSVVIRVLEHNYRK